MPAWSEIVVWLEEEAYRRRARGRNFNGILDMAEEARVNAKAERLA